MAYSAPYIDNTGMVVPLYSEIRDDLISSMKSIFGDDIYIDEDSLDYQMISIFAKKIFDTNSLALLTYNNKTPSTAIGTGLDLLCALVGITRKPATYSTVLLTVTGDPSTVITSGQATDGTNLWNLPEEVTIPDNGYIIVNATAAVAGNITALANTITGIATPTYGWLSVTNTAAANAGTDVESDASLRGRFADATMSPSSTVLEGMEAAVNSVEGVTRSKAYENDTGEEDANGIPAHSVCFVVEGGNNKDIATAIYYHKTPGCYTHGTTEVDLVSISGSTVPIRFYRPTSQTIYVKVSLTALAGYTSSYEDDIKNALVDYISNLDISETVYRSVLYSIAVSQMGSLTSPAYSITNVQLSTDGTTYTTDDIAIDFNEVAALTTANVTIEVS